MMMSRVVFFLVLALGLVFSTAALAYTPPPMTAHVTDTAHKLTEPERIAIDKKLEDYRLKTGNQIAVFVPASLDGESIEDVGVATGRAWKIGEKGKDNGVLVIIAPAERRARIEVGRGSEGGLTDLQANDIIRTKIRPRLTPGAENYRAAIDDATDAIMAALDKGMVGGTPAPHPATKASGGDILFALVFFGLIFGIPILFMILIVRAIARAFSSHGPGASSGWASGGSWSSDSSWSSGSGGGSDSSWSSGGGGGGGDSGFTGGGGDFGGGGSSDSF
jgi:uncharacterized protein